MALFPENPDPTTGTPRLMPLTRGGFRAAGCWVGPPEACGAFARKLCRKLDHAIDLLLDPRLSISKQITFNIFRMCFRASAKLTHIMRGMIPSDITAAMAHAAKTQHATIRKLLTIEDTRLPDDMQQATMHPSLATYRLHLPADCAGCSIPNPLLSYHIAHAGGTASTLPVLALSPFLATLASDPDTWATHPTQRHLNQAA
jgi:hypothetical protein